MDLRLGRAHRARLMAVLCLSAATALALSAGER